MHIPDGFLDAKTLIGTGIFSIGGIAYALKRVREILQDKMVPLMGVSAAFIFAAQMLNFPVAGGTSGHLLGGVLAAVLLGPWAGMLVISSVLIVQCLIFQDGGLLALTANIFNMGLIGAVGGYYVYAWLKEVLGKNVIAASAVAAWLSVVVASSACAVELAISGTSPLMIALPAMAGVHALIGIGEAIITGVVIGLVLNTRPDLIYTEE